MRTGSSRRLKWYPTTYTWVSSWLPFTVDKGLSWLIIILSKDKSTWHSHRLWGIVWICLDEPILIAVSKPLLSEFGIHLRLESCVAFRSSVCTTLGWRLNSVEPCLSFVWLLWFYCSPQRSGCTLPQRSGRSWWLTQPEPGSSRLTLTSYFRGKTVLFFKGCSNICCPIKSFQIFELSTTYPD